VRHQDEAVVGQRLSIATKPKGELNLLNNSVTNVRQKATRPALSIHKQSAAAHTKAVPFGCSQQADCTDFHLPSSHMVDLIELT
jgi:hypothetical protein